MRLETIEDVKNLRGSVSENYVTTELSALRLGSQVGDISCNGSEYKLAPNAVSRMCRILGVPYSFALTLSDRMPDIWHELSSRLTSQSNKRVTFKVDNNSEKVIGLFPSRDDYISIRGFLEITEILYKKISQSSGVKNIVVDITDESSSAYFYTPAEFSPVMTNSGDIFRYGIGFSVSSLECYAPSISESLYRLVCSNMTYAPSHGGITLRSRDTDRILHAVEFILKEPARMDRYPEILTGLTEKKLSYRELENAYTYVERIKDSEGNRLVTDLEKRIPLLKIALAYSYKRLEAVPRSLSWKSFAKTPVTAYEVFNHLTYIGSHYNHIPEKDRLDLLIQAGELMFKDSWDLEEVAPQDVDFSDWNPDIASCGTQVIQH